MTIYNMVGYHSIKQNCCTQQVNSSAIKKVAAMVEKVLKSCALNFDSPVRKKQNRDG